MELKQELRIKQELRLTQELTQAIKLLQLSRLELEQTVQNELVENPILEEEQRESSQLSLDEIARETEEIEKKISETESEIPSPEDEIDLKKIIEGYETFSTAPADAVKYVDEKLPPLENKVTRKPSLFDHLRWQLNLSLITELERKIGMQIIENINREGYIDQATIEEIALINNISIDDVEDVLSLIQEFDPVGVGARNLSECLYIQAKTYFPDKKIFHKLIKQHLNDLIEKKYNKILHDLDISKEELNEYLRLFQSLDPRPGLQYAETEVQYIVPDVYIRKVNNKFVVELNEDGLPKLKISPLYKKLLSKKISKKEKEYITKKFKQAVWLIRSIQQRQKTIKLVTEKIVEFQQEFLEKGEKYLKPMVLRDIAMEIGVHESTVSRVTSNKYAATPRGVFELKDFFAHSISGIDGEVYTQHAIKEKIKKIIEEENPEKPLSDQKIRQKLIDLYNIKLARRTITKYREELGIPNSQSRKIVKK